LNLDCVARCQFVDERVERLLSEIDFLVFYGIIKRITSTISQVLSEQGFLHVPKVNEWKKIGTFLIHEMVHWMANMLSCRHLHGHNLSIRPLCFHSPGLIGGGE
jgi:hypothetical protein